MQRNRLEIIRKELFSKHNILPLLGGASKSLGIQKILLGWVLKQAEE
jgi:hypothetical protein